MQSDKIQDILLALMKAQSEMGVAKKDSDNPFFKSKYADLATVQAVIEKPLLDNGLVVTQGAGLGQYGPFIYTTVYHAASGEWLRSEFPMLLAKQDPQGIGSATTYLRRYGLCAMFNIEQADDDGNSASDQSTNVHANAAKVGNSMQKAGTARANQIKEYFDANLITEAEINAAKTKHKVPSVRDLPKDVAESLINLGLDREIASNEKGNAK